MNSSAMLVVGGICALAVLGVGALWPATFTPPVAAESASVSGDASSGGSALALSSDPIGREPVHLCESPARFSADEANHAPHRAAQSEREFFEEFVALEPIALEARVETVLASDGPPPEKVAILRALGAIGSAAHLTWLEHAVRSLPDDAGPHGVSVARFALDEITGVARRDRRARATLARLAFESPSLAPALRRTAALGLARSCDDAEVDDLRVYITRESDDLLVAGVLAALGDRADCPQAARLVAEFSSRAR